MNIALQHGFRIGSFVVLPLQSRITGPDGSQHVRPEVLEVLLCMAQHQGELVERSELIDYVWDRASGSDEALTRCISELRDALHDNGDHPHYIQRIAEQGYRLLQSPEKLADGEQSSGKNRSSADTAGSVRTGFRGFFDELSRRNVFQVGGAYLIVAWLVIQIAETTFPSLNIPPWVLALLIMLAVLGFPLTLIIAWAFQVTPQGVVFELPTRSRRGRWGDIDLVIIAALLIGVAFLGYRLVYREAVAPSADTVLANQEQTPLKLEIPATENSIAVLPFVNISEDRTNDYLADGFSEDILNHLSRLKELKVASRTSAFYFKGRDVDIKTIARQLGVNTVLEGSVRRDGERLRVTAQLIDAESGFHMWSQSYDRESGDLFDIQDDIAGKVVRALEPMLSAESKTQLEYRAATDIAAYDYYLQGRAYLRQPRSGEVLDSARQLFEQALKIDSDYASAYAGLCDTYLAHYELSRSAEYFEAAERACHRAVTLDARAADVFAALGNLYFISGQYDKAEQDLEMAVSLNANSVEAYSLLASTYALQNRHERAEATYKLAIELQPGYWAGYRNLGNFLFTAGRHGKAIQQYRRVIELTPDNATGYNNLGAAHYMVGEFEQAADAWRHSLDLRPTRDTYANVGTMYYYLTRYDDAVEMYRKAIDLAPEDHRNWGSLADAYRELPGQEPEAEAAYRTAIELGLEELAINPADATTMALMAHYHANIGEAERATELLSQALTLNPKDLYVRYDAALVYVSLGELDKALNELEYAVELGYSPMLLPVDAGFAPLRELDRFNALLL